MATKKTFTREYLKDELGLPRNTALTIEDEIIDQGRWTTVHELTFRLPGQPNNEAWCATYEVGSTEHQETRPWEDEPEIECVLLHLVEKVVKVWEPV